QTRGRNVARVDDLLAEHRTVHVGHVVVEQHDVERTLAGRAQRIERLPSARYGGDLAAFVSDLTRQHPSIGLVVIDEQHTPALEHGTRFGFVGGGYDRRFER